MAKASTPILGRRQPEIFWLFYGLCVWVGWKRKPSLRGWIGAEEGAA